MTGVTYLRAWSNDCLQADARSARAAEAGGVQCHYGSVVRADIHMPVCDPSSTFDVLPASPESGRSTL
jgi:hypothetical protein